MIITYSKLIQGMNFRSQEVILKDDYKYRTNQRNMQVTKFSANSVAVNNKSMNDASYQLQFMVQNCTYVFE